MANDLIRYDLLVQEALCGVVKKVLGDVARDGELPGDHHFYITFRTHAPGVRLSSRMREQYPEEMTIILQHQYENLRVTDQAFEVGLSFKSVPETLVVPFDALTGFFDPSVPFNFKFEAQPDVQTDDAGEPGAATGPRALPTPVAPAPLVAVPKAGGPKLESARRETAKSDSAKSDSAKSDSAKSDSARTDSTKPRPVDAAQKTAAATDGDGARSDVGDGEPAKVVSIDAFRKKP